MEMFVLESGTMVNLTAINYLVPMKVWVNNDSNKVLVNPPQSSHGWDIDKYGGLLVFNACTENGKDTIPITSRDFGKLREYLIRRNRMY